MLGLSSYFIFALGWIPNNLLLCEPAVNISGKRPFFYLSTSIYMQYIFIYIYIYICLQLHSMKIQRRQGVTSCFCSSLTTLALLWRLRLVNLYDQKLSRIPTDVQICTELHLRAVGNYICLCTLASTCIWTCRLYQFFFVC